MGGGRGRGGPSGGRAAATAAAGASLWLYSAVCGALSEPAESAPTRGHSSAAEPGARVSGASAGQGTRGALAPRAVGSPLVRPTSRPFPALLAPSRNLSQVDNSRARSRPHGAPLP